MIQMIVSDGGRVVIPSEIRQFMSIKEGDTVLWQMVDGVATLPTRLAELKQAQAIILDSSVDRLLSSVSRYKC